MKVYGVVLIGCGHIGQAHISDIYWRDNIAIRAVVDRQLSRAQDFARRYGAQAADTDYRPYLERQDVDIVIIASPVSCHLPMLRDCLAHQKHVLCEKPLCATAADGAEFYRLCKTASAQVVIGHILRYNETFIRVRQLIAAGEIGQLRLARMVQNHHIIDSERYHSLLRECSPLLDCGVHYFDLLQWLSGGRITAVSGFGTRISSEFQDVEMDYGMANLFLDNGVVGYYEAGWTRSMSSNNTKEFVGDAGSISVTLNQFRGAHPEEGDLIEVYHNKDHRYQSINVPGNYKPMYRQLSALIDKIEGRPSEAPSIDEAYSAFQIGLAAEEAARTGRKIRVMQPS